MSTEYLDIFESRLEQEMLKLCTSYKMLSGILLTTDDIDDQWKKMAPEYIADAVLQINQYPTVAIAWAGYLGMAVAYGWDTDWDAFKDVEYKSFYGERGYDDMDEHIVQDLLNLELNSEQATQIEDMLRRCGQCAINMIRHEQIEGQSSVMFHVIARACKVMFRIGAAIQLKRLGYKFEKISLDS